MKKIVVIFTTGLKQLLTDPVYMGFLLGMPLLMTWLMSFLPDPVAGLASAGVIVMFIGVNLINSAGVILEERQNGTWGRLIAAPVRRSEILAGMLLKLFLTAWIQAIILLLAGKFLFHAPWSGGLSGVIMVVSSYILAMTGLGLLLAGYLKTSQQVQIAATGIVMVGTMLGGVFFPVDRHSAVMVVVAKVSPQGWAARALNDLMAHGAAPVSVQGPVIWLAVLGIVFLTLGLYRIRFE